MGSNESVPAPQPRSPTTRQGAHWNAFTPEASASNIVLYEPPVRGVSDTNKFTHLLISDSGEGKFASHSGIGPVATSSLREIHPMLKEEDDLTDEEGSDDSDGTVSDHEDSDEERDPSAAARRIADMIAMPPPMTKAQRARKRELKVLELEDNERKRRKTIQRRNAELNRMLRNRVRAQMTPHLSEQERMVQDIERRTRQLEAMVEGNRRLRQMK